ncbi:hypothetical protein A3740_18890 [Oleiphilus sp. HI0068]|uniref:hypothetical protein n=1 Tax=Oleiphilus sp. HI0132 TaxID=1822270 RepID=UPI0007C38483|nr:hypothetical protein [Oleiphilus sp. HI0132]KZY73511.1 hypothetical protein A3740_18890 [Oleiphilus sp. HI0068]KZY81205.1 hypothetical protein A3741_17590 [Oleiphilus sp. HI0069]KZZ44095.1 hypothetical protein A3755_21135 [Oleiphilus sp. HI0085]KZZ76110.1 hypothetical protein A3766_14925 [Oleiphilus sp. HI0132]
MELYALLCIALILTPMLSMGYLYPNSIFKYKLVLPLMLPILIGCGNSYPDKKEELEKFIEDSASCAVSAEIIGFYAIASKHRKHGDLASGKRYRLYSEPSNFEERISYYRNLTGKLSKLFHGMNLNERCGEHILEKDVR